MQLLEGNALARAIRTLLASGDDLRCAVAFWGPTSAAEAAARGAKVVLDISMRGTSRVALKALGAPNNRKAKVLDGLHAKIYVDRDHAIVASANASRNALGDAKRRPALREAGVLIERATDADAYREAVRIFERYWRAGTVVNAGDVARAPVSTSFPPARDFSPRATSAFSMLDELLADPGKFAKALFIFGDSSIEQPDQQRTDARYKAEYGTDGDAAERRLVYLTEDSETDALLDDRSYVLMYWFGANPDIYAYHDIVRVKVGPKMVAYFGRRQWSTVRSRLDISSAMHVAAYWQSDRARAEAIAASDGHAKGERFVILPHDELCAWLEGTLSTD